MALNDSNFLMWFGANESPTAPPLPRPFVLEPDVLSPVVWLVAGEEIVFYINATNNTAPSGDFFMQHERSNPQRHDLPHTIATIDFPGGQHAHGKFTVPPGYPEGFVRFVFGAYKTQWLFMSTRERAETCTALVTFSNSGRRLQNIRYGYLPEDFAQQFRIRLAVDTEEPAHAKEVYTESDTGKRRHLYSEPGWVVGFQTPEYDRWGHRAVASLLEHNTILINGNPYTFQSPYKSNMSAGDALSTGGFELRDELYSTLHRA